MKFLCVPDFSLCSMCQGILRYHQPELPGQGCDCGWRTEEVPVNREMEGRLSIVGQPFQFYLLCPSSLSHSSQGASFHLIIPKPGKAVWRSISMCLRIAGFQACNV